MTSTTPQQRAQAIISSLSDPTSKDELTRLTGILTGSIIQLIGSDPSAAQSLGAAIGSDERAIHNIISNIGNTTVNALSAAIAANPNIHQAIDQVIAANLGSTGRINAAINTAIAAAPPPHAASGYSASSSAASGYSAPLPAASGHAAAAAAAPLHAAAPGQVNGNVPCGTPATLDDNQVRKVRAGYCFPDEFNGCNGSILVDPRDPKKEIKTEDIFKRDSLFVNFSDGGNNTKSRDLAAISDINSREFIIENNDQYIFNYRNFFMVDPSSRNIRDNRNNTETNLVRLRYAVGNSYTRVATDLRGVMDDGTAILVGSEEEKEIIEARKTIGTFAFKTNWMICPEFFTYRMLPLKPDFMSAMEYNRSRITRNNPNKRQKCIGITPPGMEKVVNDVYVYTFVNRRTGDYITKNIPINKKERTANNTFGPGDLPYEDGFFKFPRGFEETVVCARFPDGILLFSYNGIVSPIPPLGTVVYKSKLHTTADSRDGYPDQVTHNLVTTELATVMGRVFTTDIGTLNAMVVSIDGRNLQLGAAPLARFKDIVIGGIGYITMMRVIKDIVSQETGIRFAGGRRRFITRGRRHNKSMKRNIMKSKSKGMTKSKGRGRGRGRAASMLKSAKQRFYKTGGGGMGLGFGPSVPQPLQNESPLVSQASPV